MTDIQPLKSLRILLIGDTCIDEYIYGTVERLSPESPVPVLNQTHKETKPGMAANVKLNLEMLGCGVDFITNNEKIIKTRFVDEKSGYHLLRTDQETSLTKWDRCIPNPLISYDAVVVSDYCKGFIDYQHMISLRAEFAGPIFIDTKKDDLARLEGCILKINSLEFQKLRTGCSELIVTEGKNGARYKDKIFPAPTVEVFDVCGAGDTFLSALAYMFLICRNLESSIEFAVKAAAVTVSHNGNYAPTLEEIKSLY